MKITFKKIFKFTLLMSFILFLILIAFVGIVISKSLADGDSLSLDSVKLQGELSAVNIFDNNDNAMNNVSASGKSIIKINELPSWTPNAFIAIEDKDFYRHHGINYKRIIKAFFNNLTAGYTKEGASTISQQLIKNTHLTNEKTIERKIKEYFLTIQLENKFTKEEILETYLNVIYFGNGIFGIEDASQCYFDKSAKDLTICESATLAGIIKSPYKYSPIYNPESCIKRRDLILKIMNELNYITLDEFNASIQQDLNINKNANLKLNTYERLTLEQAYKILNISEKDFIQGNYKIYTFFDEKLQNILNNNNPNEYEELSALKTDTAYIIKNNFNNGISAVFYTGNYNLEKIRRQAGSTLKPFLSYGYALEKGNISLSTLLDDSKTNFKDYTPSNVGDKYYGNISAREALAKSSNMCAIKLLEYNGIQKSVDFCRQFGIPFTENDNHLAIALGSLDKGVSLFELTDAYSALANQGQYSQGQFIKRIENFDGKILYENSKSSTHACSQETAYLLTDALKYCSSNGTGSQLKANDFEIASKTGTVGTKENNIDAFNISYTTDYTLLTWIGNTSGNEENNFPKNINGGTFTSKIASSIWNSIYSDSSPSPFIKPKDIIECEFDRIEYENNQKIKLATSSTPARYILKDWFSKYYAPKEYSNNFLSPKSVVLKGEVNNNKVILNFDTNNIYVYEIYKIEDEKTELIYTLKSEKDENFKYEYEIQKNKIIEFYVLTKQNNIEDNTIISSEPSNYIKILT